MLLLTVAGTAAFATPASAEAASCAIPTATVLPNERSLDIPTNTRIWYVSDAALFDNLQCDEAPRLLDADGAEIPTTLSTMSHLAVLTPAQPLSPMEYTVEHGCLNEAANLYQESSTFTVLEGATEDTEPPAQPDMGIADPDVSRGESGDDIVALNVEGEFEQMVLLDLDGSATLDPDALTGQVYSAHVAQEFWLSSADCAVPRPELQSGTTIELAFASFDLAGNFSGWTEAEPLTIEQTQGCQCSAGARAPAPGFAALVLLGLWARRRQR